MPDFRFFINRRSRSSPSGTRTAPGGVLPNWRRMLHTRLCAGGRFQSSGCGASFPRRTSI